MKAVLHNYLKLKKDKSNPANADLANINKDILLKDQPKMNKDFLSHIEKIHDLLLDPHIPEHLRESLMDHFHDIQDILGCSEDSEHEDHDYDNTGFDLPGLGFDDEKDPEKEPDQDSTEIKKSFLFKATTMPEEQAHDLQKAPFRPHYDGVETKELSPGLFMHSSKKKTMMGNESILHHLSTSKDPKDTKGHLAQGSLLHFSPDGHEHPSISSVKTKPGMEGKGLGKLLYQSMIKHHGGLMSDTVMSEADQRVWKSLGKHPSFDIKWAPEGNADHHEGRHVLKVKSGFEPEIPNWLKKTEGTEKQPSLKETQQLKTIKKTE